MRKIKSGVYKITNSLTGEFYVGASSNIGNRWDVHRADWKRERPKARSLLHAAIQHYGVENFVFEIIEECEPDKNILWLREEFYIDTLHPHYNQNRACRSALGVHHKNPSPLRGIPRTDETKRKCSESQKGKPRPYLHGVPKKNNKAGHYGISWRKDHQCFFVRIKNKKYGSFTNVDEALKRRDEVLAKLGMTIPTAA